MDDLRLLKTIKTLLFLKYIHLQIDVLPFLMDFVFKKNFKKKSGYISIT